MDDAKEINEEESIRSDSMIYRNDYTNKKTAGAQQYMPASGAYNGKPSLPHYQSSPHMTMNGVGGMQGYPQAQALMPSTGAVPSSGVLPAVGSIPSVPTSMHGVLPTSSAQPGNQVPSTVENTFFTAGFLRTQIGRRMRVEFLIGTNMLTDRTGTLVAVGASYIVLRPIDSDDLMMCDIYSIKFVTIIL